MWRGTTESRTRMQSVLQQNISAVWAHIHRYMYICVCSHVRCGLTESDAATSYKLTSHTCTHLHTYIRTIYAKSKWKNSCPHALRYRWRETQAWPHAATATITWTKQQSKRPNGIDSAILASVSNSSERIVNGRTFKIRRAAEENHFLLCPNNIHFCMNKKSIYLRYREKEEFL